MRNIQLNNWQADLFFLTEICAADVLFPSQILFISSEHDAWLIAVNSVQSGGSLSRQSVSLQQWGMLNKRLLLFLMLHLSWMRLSVHFPEGVFPLNVTEEGFSKHLKITSTQVKHPGVGAVRNDRSSNKCCVIVNSKTELCPESSRPTAFLALCFYLKWFLFASVSTEIFLLKA